MTRREALLEVSSKLNSQAGWLIGIGNTKDAYIEGKTLLAIGDRLSEMASLVNKVIAVDAEKRDVNEVKP